MLSHSPFPRDGRSATTTATAATVATAIAMTRVIVAIDEQQHDDDKHQPSAVITAEQVSQTHILSLLSLDIPYYDREGRVVKK